MRTRLIRQPKRLVAEDGAQQICVRLRKPVAVNGNQAIFRRVAIREDLQRAGQGRVRLTLAESFVQEKGCLQIWSDVAPDAVGFYERCGYTFVPSAPMIGKSISMQKNLA